jgi:hypothetical protein
MPDGWNATEDSLGGIHFTINSIVVRLNPYGRMNGISRYFVQQNGVNSRLTLYLASSPWPRTERVCEKVIHEKALHPLV